MNATSAGQNVNNDVSIKPLIVQNIVRFDVVCLMITVKSFSLALALKQVK